MRAWEAATGRAPCYHSAREPEGQAHKARMGQLLHLGGRRNWLCTFLFWVLATPKGPGSILLDLAEETLSEAEGRAWEVLPERQSSSRPPSPPPKGKVWSGSPVLTGRKHKDTGTGLVPANPEPPVWVASQSATIQAKTFLFF